MRIPERRWVVPVLHRLGTILLLSMGASCSKSPSTRVPLEASADSSRTGSLPTATSLLENGDLETGALGAWAGTDVAIDSTVAHGGKYSLRLTWTSERPATVSRQTVPLPGKQLRLTLRASVKTADAGLAILWLRGEDESGKIVAFKNTEDKPIRGSTDWQAIDVSLDLPPEAKLVRIGVYLKDGGQAWFDDLVATLRVPSEETCIGRVVDAAGDPVAGAMVALVSPADLEPTAIHVSDANGRFEFRPHSGAYGLTATSPGHVAVHRPTAELPDASGPITLTMGTAGISIQGRIDTGERPLPADVRVVITRLSDLDSDVFAVPVTKDGVFAARFPVSPRGYWVYVNSSTTFPNSTRIGGDADQNPVITLSFKEVPPPEIVAAAQAGAIRLASAEAGHGFEDLEPLGKMIGNARIVALGEATHGTREMFQMKHRILEYLVEKHRFTVFAIEANWPESMVINDYVRDGKGDAKTALAGIYFWTWDTEEVLEMIEWMRRYNLDPTHARKIEFQGFDMQATTVAVDSLLAYLAHIDVALADRMRLPLGGYSGSSRAGANPTASKALAEVERRFDTNKEPWVASKGLPAWTIARQHARILRQAEITRSDSGGFNARDAAMAENTTWLLDQYPEGTRMVLWAHNGHITKSRAAGWEPMGEHLEKSYGPDYVPIGMLFGEGSFQAIGRPPRRPGLQEFTVGPPPKYDLATLFDGLPLAALDLRTLPDPVIEWLREPRVARSTGALFSGDERSLETPTRLTNQYEIVLWFAKTTRARPVVRSRPAPLPWRSQ